MNATSLGFVIGLMIAAVLIVFIFKFANKDGKVKTEYDERQKAVRGKAYKYAFYTEVFAQAILMCLFMSDIEIPVQNYVLIFIGIILGCMVLATYCIWNDVYWGLNNDHRKYHIVFIVALIFNILPVFFNAIGGSLMEDGKLGMPALNIVVIFMMVIIYAELLFKKIREKASDEEG